MVFPNHLPPLIHPTTGRPMRRAAIPALAASVRSQVEEQEHLQAELRARGAIRRQQHELFNVVEPPDDLPVAEDSSSDDDEDDSEFEGHAGFASEDEELDGDDIPDVNDPNSFAIVQRNISELIARDVFPSWSVERTLKKGCLSARARKRQYEEQCPPEYIIFFSKGHKLYGWGEGCGSQRIVAKSHRISCYRFFVTLSPSVSFCIIFIVEFVIACDLSRFRAH